MQLTLDEVRHVSELAKLRLSEEEIAEYTEQLSAILEYADTLRAVDTSGIPPTPFVLDIDTVMRADEPGASLTNEEVLANAPDSADGFFRVKAVFGQ